MSDHRDIVSDHAIVRYLERVYGVNIDAIRKRIVKVTAKGRAQGADAVHSDGVKYRMSKSGRVTTVHGPSSPLSNRARRWKARHK